MRLCWRIPDFAKPPVAHSGPIHHVVYHVRHHHSHKIGTGKLVAGSTTVCLVIGGSGLTAWGMYKNTPSHDTNVGHHIGLGWAPGSGATGIVYNPIRQDNTQVPEPSTLWLMFVPLAFLWLLKRKQAHVRKSAE